ncbi:MAG: hypothetical protein JW757_13515, partial [Anaerolineales bacterium]|nr:hypothetical protein [Anaerolineales bacterium]
MLQVRLLGQFEIYLDGQPIIIPTRPAQSLFAFLLIHPQKSYRREKLAGQFWPNATEINARSNLRHALWRIRKAFGTSINERLQSDDLVVTYTPRADDQVDVYSLEACLNNEDCIDEHILAVSAYEGDLLPGFYDDWVMLERERLQAVYERRLEKLMG